MTNHKKFVVIVPAFNNSEWLTDTLDSILSQDYDTSLYRIIYIDDCSTDDSLKVLHKYLEEKKTSVSITVIINTLNYGGLFNIWRAVHMCDDDEIIITVDGDDILVGIDVFNILNREYSSKDIWLTYGQYIRKSDQEVGHCSSYDQSIIQNQSYRLYQWKASHLRTFYAGLFKQICLSDFFDKTYFFKIAWDLAFMFPMLEMAGDKFSFLNTVLYEYNDLNNLNDYKKDFFIQIYFDIMIRNRKRYQRLESYHSKNNYKVPLVDLPIIYFDNCTKKHLANYTFFNKIYGTQNIFIMIPEGLEIKNQIETELQSVYAKVICHRSSVDFITRKRNRTYECKKAWLDFLNNNNNVQYVLVCKEGIILPSQDFLQDIFFYMSSLKIGLGFFIGGYDFKRKDCFPLIGSKQETIFFLSTSFVASTLLSDVRNKVEGFIIDKSLLLSSLELVYFTYDNFYALLAAIEENLFSESNSVLFI